MSLCPVCGHHVDRPSIEALNSLRISWQRRRILDVLAKNFGKWVQVRQIINAVWCDDINGGPDNPVNSISVQAFYLKKQLKGSGFAIESLGGQTGGRRLVWAA